MSASIAKKLSKGPRLIILPFVAFHIPEETQCRRLGQVLTMRNLLHARPRQNPPDSFISEFVFLRPGIRIHPSSQGIEGLLAPKPENRLKCPVLLERVEPQDTITRVIRTAEPIPRVFQHAQPPPRNHLRNVLEDRMRLYRKLPPKAALDRLGKVLRQVERKERILAYSVMTGSGVPEVDEEIVPSFNKRVFLAARNEMVRYNRSIHPRHTDLERRRRVL